MADKDKAGINIDDSQLNKILANAVVTWLTPEKRDELLVLAVGNFFESKGTGYDKTTLIEQQFKDAIREVGKNVAIDLIRTDENLMKRIKDECLTGMNKVLDSGKLAEHVASSFERFFNGKIF